MTDIAILYTEGTQKALKLKYKGDEFILINTLKTKKDEWLGFRFTEFVVADEGVTEDWIDWCKGCLIVTHVYNDAS